MGICDKCDKMYEKKCKYGKVCEDCKKNLHKRLRKNRIVGFGGWEQ